MDAIELRTDAPSTFDRNAFLEAVADHHVRFVAQLRALKPHEWAAPSRNADWTVQDTVRHLCDTSVLLRDHVAARTDPFPPGFDPRTTPREWLEGSSGDTPDETLARLESVTEDILKMSREAVAEGLQFEMHAPYGPVDWSVLLLHWFWDRWVHERDVLTPFGRPGVTGHDGSFLATAYALFVAGAVARLFGLRTEISLALSGTGAGRFTLQVDDAAVLSAKPGSQDGPETAAVGDALSGRGLPLTDLMPLTKEQAGALGALAAFFTTPI